MQTFTCLNCGNEWTRKPVRGQVPKWCPDCRTSPNGGRGKPRPGTCISCGTDTGDKRCIRCVTCDVERRRNWPGKQLAFTLPYDQRGPLRKAIEDGNYKVLTAAIFAKSRLDEQGCWIWLGQFKNDYPIYKIGAKHFQVHRLALEGKLGSPLGAQTAHHVCAVSKCVNPEHLQQVTRRDNTAEMLARQDYIRRVVALELALSAVAPGHELLREAPLGGVLRPA